MKKLNKATVKHFVGIIKGDPSVTCWREFARDDKYIWAFVFGYFEAENEQDLPCIAVKVAYCPKNSAMNEYDIDWRMPWDDYYNEVDDTEMFRSVVNGNYEETIEHICEDIKFHNEDAERFIRVYVGKYDEKGA